MSSKSASGKRAMVGIPARVAKRKPLTELQQARYAAMRAAYDGRGIDQTDIKEALEDRGVTVSRASIGAVLLDLFRNEEIISVFCRMTGTKASAMFPA